MFTPMFLLPGQEEVDLGTLDLDQFTPLGPSQLRMAIFADNTLLGQAIYTVTNQNLDIYPSTGEAVTTFSTGNKHFRADNLWIPAANTPLGWANNDGHNYQGQRYVNSGWVTNIHHSDMLLGQKRGLYQVRRGTANNYVGQYIAVGVKINNRYARFYLKEGGKGIYVANNYLAGPDLTLVSSNLTPNQNLVSGTNYASLYIERTEFAPPPNKLFINYYLDGQHAGAVIYDMLPNIPQIPIYPVAAGINYRSEVTTVLGELKYSNFTHPIAGFEDGWRDLNGQVYPGSDTEDHSWVGSDVYIHKPLGQRKGMLELDTKTHSYHSLGINIDGWAKQAVYTGPDGTITHNLHSLGTAPYGNPPLKPDSHPQISGRSSPLTPSTLTGRYIGMTVEFT